VSRLRYPLKDRLSNPTSEEALARIWRGIDAREPRPQTARAGHRAGWFITSAVATGALAITFWAIPRGDHGPLRFADGRPLAAVDAPAAGAVLSMSDGSLVDLAGGARLAPLESTGTSFVAMLERGSAHFEVRPGGPRRWQIECGLATVEVVGTGFDCARAPGRLRVTVEHGAVLVRGERVPDRARRLAAGETLDVVEAPVAPTAPATPSRPATPSTPAAPSTMDQAAAPAEAIVAAAPAARPAEPAGASGAAWRELARDGHHHEAFASLGTQGIARETRRGGVADLLVLADVARLSGHGEEAVAPLERILRRFPGDPQAPLAALALGRLELDTLHRPADAAVALERALALGVPASLREDVRARLVEAYARAENRPAARAAAAAYVREFPHGRDLPLVQSRLR
jgi:transmembrane sensor